MAAIMMVMILELKVRVESFKSDRVLHGFRRTQIGSVLRNGAIFILVGGLIWYEVYEKVEAYSFLSFGGVGDSKVKYFETDCFWAFLLHISNGRKYVQTILNLTGA